MPTPLSDEIASWIKAQTVPAERPLVLMVSGAQGIGKTTALQAIAVADPKTIVLGLDDFYLTKRDRLRLSQEVHPLFDMRGPPGTHDLPLLNSTLDRLMRAWEDEVIPVPVFSKKLDDRLPEDKWHIWNGRPRVILIEGWMIGATPDDDAASAPPLNSVEAEDRDGVWRGFQETYLRAAYSRLWDRADAFCHIRAPSFETVLGWRVQQEAGNIGVCLSELPIDRIRWVERFIQYYERITRRMINGQHRPGRVIDVDETRHLRA